MQTHRAFFESCGQFYLTSKGLSFDTWIEAIDEGRKGDVLTLYGLSLLTDVHTSPQWSILDNVKDSAFNT